MSRFRCIEDLTNEQVAQLVAEIIELDMVASARSDVLAAFLDKFSAELGEKKLYRSVSLCYSVLREEAAVRLVRLHGYTPTTPKPKQVRVRSAAGPKKA